MKKILTVSLIFLATSLLSSNAWAKNSAKKLPIKRGPASFTQGFKVINKTCKLRKSPTVDSDGLAKVNTGKKIWMTAMDSQWLIAKTQSDQEVYIHASCVN